MKSPRYRDQDFGFGQSMLSLRSKIGLTQEAVADFLGVSRRSVGAWEAGSKYPKAAHLRRFIELAVEHGAFTAGNEADEIRALWRQSQQRVLLDKYWLAGVLRPAPDAVVAAPFDPPHKTDQATTRQVKHNHLPFQPTSFIGRNDELSDIARILADPACRLLTLIGPGGIGKTRLALEVAANHQDAFADGVVFVALASATSPVQLLSALADSLDLSFGGSTDPQTQLLHYLRERHQLLVLDNFEHLLEAADLVNTIIQQCPALQILVTSRLRLDLQAEWLFDVEGLAYPQDLEPGEPGDYSAIQLFVQRASQVQSGVAFSETNQAHLLRICQQVAGIPLAIELAAAGLRSHSIDEIEQQIQGRLDSLSTSLRDVPARHRSMRAVFDHSWNLLSRPERTLFSRLAVFRGSFTAEAAAQVAGASIPALLSLVDQSLLRPSDEQRFFLLEPIREYALERLAAQGEAESIQRTHAIYFLELAEMAAAQWDSPLADEGLGLLLREHDNMHAALAWTRTGGNPAIGLKLATALTRFWRMHGDIAEGRVWLADLLVLTEQDDDPAIISIRMRALHQAGWLAADQHDFDQAARLFEQSADLRRALGETVSETTLLINAGLQARAAGQYQRATLLLEDALSQLRAQGDRGSLSTGGLGFSLYALALILREQGDFERATALFTECMDFHQEIGEREGMAQALLGLSDVARDLGDPSTARRYGDNSLEIFHEFETQWAIGFTLNNLAQASYQEDNLDQAVALAKDSIALFRSINNESGLAEVLIALGYIQLAQQELAAAHDSLAEALRYAWTLGPRLMVAAALEAMAAVTTESGASMSAIRYLAASSGMRTEMGTLMRPADRPILERTQARLQSTLEMSDFALAWSEAAALPLEQVVQAVFGEAEDMRLPTEPAAANLAPSPASGQAKQQSKEAPGPQVDWNDAPRIPNFYGREWELDILHEWVIDERCRVVALLGLGGIGKSTIAVNLMQQVAAQFDVVIWRSLRDIPTCDVLSSDLAQVLVPNASREETATFEQRITLLLERMREIRVLMVLDNIESALEDGDGVGFILPNFEGFERFLSLVAATMHQSCVLFTSREKPEALIPYEGSHAPVRSLRLARLNAEACDQILTERGVTGSPDERAVLIEAYAGNPLALKIVSRTIVDLFNGEPAPFLAQGEMIFGGIRELLAAQFKRLSAFEQSLLLWLAILREPATLNELLALQVTPVPGARLLEAVEALHRQSLVERGHKSGSFTLQSVVLDYVTARLVADAVAEIRQGKLTRLLGQGLELALVREYVRHTQERLIIAPILMDLRSAQPNESVIEDMLRNLLDQMRQQPQSSQGYGPANLISLLRHLRGDLRGLDFSRLLLRRVQLQGVEMQDTTLAGAVILDSTLTEAFDAVISVAVSSSGEYWAASTRSGEVRIWDTDGQTLRWSWQAHADMIWTLAFSPDGRSLASGSWDGMVKLWDFVSGSLLWTGRHVSLVKWLVFSPDGSMIASAGNDAVVRLWDAVSGQELATLPHSVPVPALAWSPDGRRLASGDREGVIRLWEISDTTAVSCMLTLEAHTNWVDGLAWSPDGQTLASVGWDRSLKIWDIEHPSLFQELAGHSDWTLRVVWSPDGRLVATCSRDRSLRLWDVERGECRLMLQGHTAEVDGLAFTPDSHYLLSGGEDGTLRRWDVRDGHCLQVIQGYAETVHDVAWSSDGSHLASGGSDTLVSIHNVSNDTAPMTLRGHTSSVLYVAWSPDDHCLASTTWDNVVRLWDPKTGNVLNNLRHPHDSANVFSCLAWSGDALRLACGTHQHGILLYDYNAISCMYNLTEFALPTWIRSVAWKPDGSQLAGGGDDGLIYIVDRHGTALLHQLIGHQSMITSLAWNASGTLLVSSSRGLEGGELFLWDMQRQEQAAAFAGHPTIVYAAAWNLDETQLISADGDGTLRWWDIHSGACLRTRPAHQGAIHALRRTPDGTLLASCGVDGAIMLWDNASGEHRQTLRRDRPYERLNVRGVSGITEAQLATLRALGAVEK
ncbi:MAG: tetratricopeptide repeat protein [Anaerolineae bacterium]|nr:tetratricopeptide repeat protein [Anaerolineae bacterium]